MTIFTRYNGGDLVTPGHYIDTQEMQMQFVAEPDFLPGDSSTRYIRIPAVLLLPLAALLGASLVLFLPFVGFWLIGATIYDYIAGFFYDPDEPAVVKFDGDDHA